MDHLQTDIDSLESEKGQLKEKLKSIGKKTLSTSGTDNTAGNTSMTSTMDNKYYVQEINALREALSNEHLQKKKIMCDVLRQKLDSLEPLSSPANLKSLDSTIQDLRKKTTDLVKVQLQMIDASQGDCYMSKAYFARIFNNLCMFWYSSYIQYTQLYFRMFKRL